MQDVITFWTQLLQAVAQFLMTEPISWFTGIFILMWIVVLVKKICF